MKRKYQIFISSTYKDLIRERQAAVEAILQAGHIPAGMELFAAGDETQLNVIKRWINESDIYVLILGPRYGSIDKQNNKSYTELEYDYALKQKIPMFSIVIDEVKLKRISKYKIESESTEYLDFRSKVTSNVCRFFKDYKDIKISILESIMEIEKRKDLIGWVSGTLLDELKILEMKTDLTESIKSDLSDETQNLFSGIPFKELKSILEREKINVPDGLSLEDSGKSISLLKAMLGLEAELHSGVSFDHGLSNWFWYQNQVAMKLKTFGLTENGMFVIKLSDSGKRFLLQLRRASV